MPGKAAVVRRTLSAGAVTTGAGSVDFEDRGGSFETVEDGCVSSAFGGVEIRYDGRGVLARVNAKSPCGNIPAGRFGMQNVPKRQLFRSAGNGKKQRRAVPDSL